MDKAMRYLTQRAHDGHWLPYAPGLVTACTQDQAGNVTVNAWGGHHYTVPARESAADAEIPAL